MSPQASGPKQYLSNFGKFATSPRRNCLATSPRSTASWSVMCFAAMGSKLETSRGEFPWGEVAELAELSDLLSRSVGSEAVFAALPVSPPQKTPCKPPEEPHARSRLDPRQATASQPESRRRESQHPGPSARVLRGGHSSTRCRGIFYDLPPHGMPGNPRGVIYTKHPQIKGKGSMEATPVGERLLTGEAEPLNARPEEVGLLQFLEFGTDGKRAVSLVFPLIARRRPAGIPAGLAYGDPIVAPCDFNRDRGNGPQTSISIADRLKEEAQEAQVFAP